MSSIGSSYRGNYYSNYNINPAIAKMHGDADTGGKKVNDRRLDGGTEVEKGDGNLTVEELTAHRDQFKPGSVEYDRADQLLKKFGDYDKDGVEGLSAAEVDKYIADLNKAQIDASRNNQAKPKPKP